ncbi:hypothetical protein [uncultured Variovorax sp.]|uniref:hypothetical protein n=1 Tax=uncultured Variovorax sp. TaxID=114708 RepID=UPI0025E0A96F|nr:hypothetical protein [uncultured Variovorax sp.]
MIDVIDESPKWMDWLAAAFTDCLNRGKLEANPLVYAEVSAYFNPGRDADSALPA